ncbi:MAG TPA: hypothetical protein K8W07_04165 [Bacteroides togonis]|nr:hypothetical protein [Bacteroides togonis]
MKNIGLLFVLLFSIPCYAFLQLTPNKYDLSFLNLSQTWDEAIPLGNATIGSLVWQKDNNLRMSIDRADLWDLRHSKELEGDGFSFKWLYEQVQKGDYEPVQKRFDFPYNGYAGPSKIPGAGIEFPLDDFGKVKSVHLYQRQAVCEVIWESGKVMRCFVHASEPVGWFVFEGVDEDFLPSLIPPVYDKKVEHRVKDQSRHGLYELGYKQGAIEKVSENKYVYTQHGWNNFSYSVALKWKFLDNKLIGVWSATSSLINEMAGDLVDVAMDRGIKSDYDTHLKWWNDFYDRSSIKVPDKIIEKQYYNEVYKIGCIARENSYPISLQSIWTADNGQLPPWKGDYHHDLNTQLSYWPFYIGNYLKEGYGYLNTLWNQREVHKAYTKEFFGTEGLNVPGVCTLEGRPMGGWCQYALGPTVSAWLSQHFYLHWKYSGDRDFLKNKAYPYIKDVAIYLEQFAPLKNGRRSLPLSSSPEFRGNSIKAWFNEMTNFDRALVHFVFNAASELAQELGMKEEAAKWKKINLEFPDLLMDEEGGLAIAENVSYRSSHRHFSHLMAIHPLGLVDKSLGVKSSAIIDASLKQLDKYGPSGWTGYSYAWLANLKARAFDGEGAVEALRIFAECFCLRNGFHANGDQSGTGKSNFTYRPFTLEGNMAFASGVQEMLLQSHTGIIRLFPAIPKDWQNVSFKKLRAVGAFVVSAKIENGRKLSVNIFSENGGTLRLHNPFSGEFKISNKKAYVLKAGTIEVEMKQGEMLNFVGLK